MATPIGKLQPTGQFRIGRKLVTGDDVAAAVRGITDEALRQEIEDALRYDAVPLLSQRALKAVKEQVLTSLAYRLA
jgi:hypothetical protein